MEVITASNDDERLSARSLRDGALEWIRLWIMLDPDIEEVRDFVQEILDALTSGRRV